jgi:diguanylate cyclase (GGDEF)-like protein
MVRCVATLIILALSPLDHRSAVFVTVCAVVALYSFVSAMPSFKKEWATTSPELIVTGDVLLASMLVYSTGGLGSPFLSVLYLPVLEGAIGLSWRSAFGIAVWTVTLVGYFGAITGLQRTISVTLFQRFLNFMAVAFALTIVYGGVIRFYRQRISSLEEDRERLRDLADRDPLTGVLNRRAFVERFEAELKSAGRHQAMLALAILDIDNMKQINDAWGHPAGDKALVNLTKRLSDSCRSQDVVGRYGGDEFVVLLPHTGEDGVRRWIERILEVESKELPNFSVGYAVFPTSGQDFATLIEAADRSLYMMKTSEQRDGDAYNLG